MNGKDKDEFIWNIVDTNSIVTGGRCPVKCAYCFCIGDHKDIDSHLPFISKQDLLDGCRYISWRNKLINLGDGISRLSAEAFAHPQIYEFLEILSRSFPQHRIMVSTTGVLVDEDKIDFINSLKNVKISLSVNTLNAKHRKRIYPKPETNKVKKLLKNLKDCGLQLFNIDGVDTLQEDITEMSGLRKTHPAKMVFQLKRIEHTRFHGEKAKVLSKKSIETYEEAECFVNSNCPAASFWAAYTGDYLISPKTLPKLYQYIAQVIDFCVGHAGQKIVFPAAESSFDLWKTWLAGSKNVQVVPVKNHTYGGSIIVSGLLTFQDVKMAIESLNYDIVLIPHTMVNRAMRDLFNTSIVDFGAEIKAWPMVI